MSTLEQKLNLPLASLKEYMCIYLPDGRQSADDWASAETAKVKIGEIYTVFHPARAFAEGEDMSELRIAGLAIVFREDAGFPMTYFLEDNNFEMSFLEGVLSSKASEAREQGLAFYCLHSKLVKPLTKETSTALNTMHKWGGAGERHKANQGLPDPLFQFFTSFGAVCDPSLSHEPLPIPEAVLALWNPSALPAKSKAPKVSEYFVAPQIASEPAAPSAPAPAPAGNGGSGMSLSALLGDDWLGGSKPPESVSSSSAPPAADASGSNNLLEKLASSVPGTPEKPAASGPSLADLLSPSAPTPAADKPAEKASPSLSDLLGPVVTPPAAKAASLEDLLTAPSAKPPAADPFATPATNAAAPSTPSLSDLLSDAPAKPAEPASKASDLFSDSAPASKVPGDAFGSLFDDDAPAAAAPPPVSATPAAPVEATPPVAKPGSLADLFKSSSEKKTEPSAGTAGDTATAPPSSPATPSLSDLLSGVGGGTAKPELTPPSTPSTPNQSTPSLSDLLSGTAPASATPASTPPASPADPALASSAGNSLSSLISGVSPAQPAAAATPSLSDLIAGKSENTPAEPPKPATPSLSDLLSGTGSSSAAPSQPAAPAPGASLSDLLSGSKPAASEPPSAPVAPATASLSDLISGGAAPAPAASNPASPSLSELLAPSPLSATTPNAADFGLPPPNPVMAPPATPKASKPFVPTTFNDHDDAWNMLKSKPKETVPGLDTADELMRQAAEEEAKKSELKAEETSAPVEIPPQVNKPVPISSDAGLDPLEDLRSALAEEIAASLALNLDDEPVEASTEAAGPVPIQAKAADEVADLKNALAEEIAASLSLNLGDDEAESTPDSTSLAAEVKKPSAMDELAAFTSLGKELASTAEATAPVVEAKKKPEDSLIDMETLLAESLLPSARSIAKEQSVEAAIADAKAAPGLGLADLIAAPAQAPAIAEAPKAEVVAEAPAAAEAPKAEVVAEAPAVAEVPKAEVVAEAPAVVEAPKAEVVAEAPAVVEAPKAEVVAEAPAAVEAPKAEVVAEAPAAVEAPKAAVVAEAPAAVEAPKAEVVAEAQAAVEAPKAEVVAEAQAVVEAPKTEVVAEAPAAVEEPKDEVVAEAPAAAEAPKAEVVAEAPAAVEAPKAEVVAEAQAVVEAPKTEVVAEAPAAVEEPKAEVVAGAPAAVEAPKAEQLVAEAPAAVEAPKAEVVVEAPAAVEAPKAELVVEAPAPAEGPNAELVAEAQAALPDSVPAVPIIAPASTEAPEQPKKALIAAQSSTSAVLAAVTSDALEDGPKGAVQKKLSLQATLGKLEEQSGKALVRLQEFKKAHEADCIADQKLVREQREQYEKDAQAALLLVHERIIASMKELVLQGKETLKAFVGGAESQISERLPAALAELEKIAAESDISNVAAELETASNAFLELCQERLQTLDEEQARKMNDISGGAAANLKDWRNTQLKSFNESFEQILQRVEQHRIASLSALESCVHSLSEELARMKELDLRRLALLNSELRETLEESCNLAEMKLTRHCDMALAEQILPLLADLKSKLALKTREIRLAIAEELERNSQASLADFEPVLVLGKEAVILIGSNVLELKENIVENDKKELDFKVDDLNKYFDSQVEALTAHFNEVRKQLSQGANTQESAYNKKLKQLSDSCKKKITEVRKTTQTEIEKQNDVALAAWSSKVEDLSVHQTGDFGAEIEAIKNHRRESLRKLQEKLNKLSGKVQTLQAQLIQ